MNKFSSKAFIGFISDLNMYIELSCKEINSILSRIFG